MAIVLSAHRPRKNILVVDDEPDILLTLKVLLEGISGYNVTSHAYPEHALADFQTNSYDLVVLDIRMPDINGFELYRRMKRTLIEKGAEMTTVCFLTALEDLDNYSEYKLEVCPSFGERRFFVKKPVTNEDLLERVQSMLDMKDTGGISK